MVLELVQKKTLALRNLCQHPNDVFFGVFKSPFTCQSRKYINFNRLIIKMINSTKSGIFGCTNFNPMAYQNSIFNARRTSPKENQ